MSEKRPLFYKTAIDSHDGKRLSVSATAFGRKPFVELRLRRLDGLMKGESVTELTLRQGRALRAALDAALASFDSPVPADDGCISSGSDGRRPAGEVPDDAAKPQSAA